MAEGDTNTSSKPMLHTDTDFQAAQDILKKECEEIWQTIRLLQDDVTKSDNRQGADIASTSESVLHDIHLAKEQQLRAQIDVLRNTEPSVLPLNDVVQFEVVRKEVETSIGGLQQTVTLVQSELEELDRELEQEELFKSETEQVQSVLQEKLSAALEGQQGDDDNSLLNDLKHKETMLKKYHRQLMKKMAAFVGEHFPEPSEENIQKWKSQVNKQSSESHSSMEGVEYMSLLLLLQNLLNQCMDSPHDPYIAITEQFWPPYVELLVRSCIAVRNPDNHNEIRLMPFHMWHV